MTSLSCHVSLNSINWKVEHRHKLKFFLNKENRINISSRKSINKYLMMGSSLLSSFTLFCDQLCYDTPNRFVV